MIGKCQNVVIYPSWSDFGFKWEELVAGIDKPESWGLKENIRDYIDLGYSVSSSDQSLLDGPGVGGLICVHRDLVRWLPAALFRTEANFQSVPGFSKASLFQVHFLVGRITTEHKLGMAPYPLAPSPLFSLERTNIRPGLLHVAIGDISDKSFPILSDRVCYWSDTTTVSTNVPDGCRERFEATRRPRF